MDKLPVVEVMNRAPVTTAEDATVSEAAGLMSDLDVGGLVVMSDGRPIGIVTERDVVRKVVAAGRMPDDVLVSDVMSSPLVTIHASADVADVARAMALHRVRRLPVVGPAGLVGIVTDRDLLAISPALFDMARDGTVTPRLVETEDGQEHYEGRCEGCHTLSDVLHAMNGQVLCDDCVDDNV